MSVHAERIETERLTMSIIGMGDAMDVFHTMNDPHTARIISFMQWPMTMEQAENWCRKSEEGQKNKTGMIFIARDKKDGSPAGCIGLHDIKSTVKPGPEIGYWVLPASQGRGYASEMLKAVLDLAFERMDLPFVHATAIFDNLKSRRVLEKQGFRITGQIVKSVTPGKVAERNVFELEKSFYVS